MSRNDVRLRHWSSHCASIVFREAQSRPPTNPRARWIFTEACRLLAHVAPDSDACGDDAGSEFALFAATHWHDLADGKSGALLLRRDAPGLWGRLMTGWPMSEYPRALARHLPPLHGMRVLEIGAGVGSLTRRLDPHSAASYIVTDLDPVLAAHTVTRYGGSFAARLDLDNPEMSPLVRGPYDLIVGSNVLHCLADPEQAIAALADRLAPGGTLAFAEGTPGTKRPWALTWAFGMMDGWWDRGGFRPSTYWYDVCAAAGLDVQQPDSITTIATRSFR